jgi:hypothetical protein
MLAQAEHDADACANRSQRQKWLARLPVRSSASCALPTAPVAKQAIRQQCHRDRALAR